MTTPNITINNITFFLIRVVDNYIQDIVMF